jgi:hypothetical protein
MAADAARATTCSALSNAIRAPCISVNLRNLRLPEKDKFRGRNTQPLSPRGSGHRFRGPGGRVVSTSFLAIENGVVARRPAGTAMRCMWFGNNRDFCDSRHSSVHAAI